MDLLEPTRERVARIETAAADALAPAEEAAWEGWRLRFNHGVTRRGNSALPERRGDRPLARSLRAVEEFYRARGVAARVQLSPASQPRGLDAALAERGWRHEPGARVLWLGLREPGPTAAPAGAAGAGRDGAGDGDARYEVDVADTPGPRYRAVQGAVSPGAEAWAEARAEALREAGLVPWHLVIGAGDGDGLAAGLAVLDPSAGLLGLFSLATLPEARGRGLGSLLLAEALRRGRAAGAEGAYLQVDVRNEAAQRLYRRIGFASHHAYHYRRAPDAAGDGRG